LDRKVAVVILGIAIVLASVVMVQARYVPGDGESIPPTSVTVGKFRTLQVGTPKLPPGSFAPIYITVKNEDSIVTCPKSNLTLVLRADEYSPWFFGLGRGDVVYESILSHVQSDFEGRSLNNITFTESSPPSGWRWDDLIKTGVLNVEVPSLKPGESVTIGAGKQIPVEWYAVADHGATVGDRYNVKAVLYVDYPETDVVVQATYTTIEIGEPAPPLWIALIGTSLVLLGVSVARRYEYI